MTYAAMRNYFALCVLLLYGITAGETTGEADPRAVEVNQDILVVDGKEENVN